MINRLIEVALKHRFMVVILYLGLAGWGWWALTATPITSPAIGGPVSLPTFPRLSAATPVGDFPLP